MIENQVCTAQFGQPGKPITPPGPCYSFGSFAAIPRRPQTAVLLREAVLLLAEQGFTLAQIADHQRKTLEQIALILLVDDWTWEIPHSELDTLHPWPGLTLAYERRFVNYIQGKQLRQMFIVAYFDQQNRLSSALFRVWRKEIGSLHEQGYFRMTHKRGYTDIHLTVRGEAVAILLRGGFL